MRYWLRTSSVFAPVSLIRYALAISLVFLALSSSLAYAGPARLNCGGGAFLAGDVLFEADRPYTAGAGSGYVGGFAYFPGVYGGGPVEGTKYSKLFSFFRLNPSEYRFDVPNGTYMLTLGFTEMNVHGPALREFSVLAEGRPLLVDFDIFRRVEKNYAITVRFALQVTDGQLNVTFVPTIDQAVISSIEVVPLAVDSIPPPSPLSIGARGGYYRNILQWSPSQAEDVAAYLVFRARPGGGPFQFAEATPLTRFFDDDVLPGEVYIYRLLAMDVFGNFGSVSTPVYAIAETEAASTLPVYKITLDPGELARLQADPMSDEYLVGDFEHGGVLYPGVGVRYRGWFSRLANKKSWKINFRKEQPFQNRDKLELDAQDLDPAMVRDCIAFELFEGVSTHSPECGHSHLQVNGEFRGVFSHVEDIDEDFLEARGLDASSSLYEAAGLGGAQFILHPTVEAYQMYWEKKTGGLGHGDLIEFIERINLTPSEEFERALASVFNVDAYLDYYATIIFTGNHDHVYHNYFVYRNPSSNIWELIPEDNDAAFYLTEIPIDFGTEASPGILLVDPPEPIHNVLTTRVLDVPRFRQRYVDKMRELLSTDFSPLAVIPLMEEYMERIAHDAHADVFKMGRQSNEVFDQSIEVLQSFVSRRWDFLISRLDAFEPGIPQTLFINELLARNVNDVTDDWGEHEDWIELYNPNGDSFDLTGHYLTDDLSDPTQWAFAPGTSVPPGGYLLVWADDEPAQGSLHASFKISRQGEALGLFGPDGEGNPMLDFIAFGPQETDVSFGRRFDGSYLWATQAATSPGGANPGPGKRP